MLDKVGFLNSISNIRLYLSLQNILTLTKYKGFDPNFNNDGLFNRGVDNGSYPSPRTIMIGGKFSF
jgi:hypothetical protein